MAAKLDCQPLEAADINSAKSLTAAATTITTAAAGAVRPNLPPRRAVAITATISIAGAALQLHPQLMAALVIVAVVGKV